ncbi:MAG: hypothetical protein GX330_08140 [Bacteroidales bacterium]|nr:hypothetical protein [Bacteroidales bacterium]
MTQVIIEYDADNEVARKLMEFVASSGIVNLKTIKRTKLDKAIEEVANDDVIVCDSYEDYVEKTKKYA